MISQYLPSGSKIGVGYQVHALANALCDRGHDVTVFSGCPASAGARYRTEQLLLQGHLRTFRFASALRRVDLSSYDVLHAHGDDYWLWKRRVPAHVRTLHGSCFDEALRISGLKERVRMLALGLSEVLATAVADRTVVVSPHTRRWTPWVRDVIPNGVDGRLFFPGREKESTPTILFVGTYGQRKRGRLLMEAFRTVVQPALPSARLWMVSTDAPEADGVVLHGRVGDKELVDLYRRAWVFCLPSTYEGFGIPYAEALCCGTPVVATPNPGSTYVLDGGSAGVLVGADDLGAALLDVLTDTTLRHDLAQRGLRRSRDFLLSDVVSQYERLYEGLIASQPG